MGDFLLDFRAPAERNLAKTAERLHFAEHTQAAVFHTQTFGLVATFTEDASLWAPYRAPDGTLIAIAGRIALDEDQWQAGEIIPGEGGLAAKAFYSLYQVHGLDALHVAGGNCAILLHDTQAGEFHLITDRAGAFPVFRSDNPTKLLFGSHPDVLAAAAGLNDDLDEASMAEFLLTSTVTPPFTYYRGIRAVDHGSITTIRTDVPRPVLASTRHYFELSYQPNANRTEDELADELALALRKAVRRGTLPRLGRTAVALSGGLDSRALLACVENRDQLFAFCCYNEPNRELATAAAIAKALDVRFLPWQRTFEYYGDNAEQGVRISGGMGTFANNHFLGVVNQLRAEGAQNLLTGCYCDYLFKGLPLNTRKHWLTGREQLAPFTHQFYFDHYLRPSPFAEGVRARLESRVPAEFQSQDTDAAVFNVETRRTFPLCYEGDNQQRVVPQRVTGWFLPMADRDILDVYCKLPWRYKLNRSVYTKAVRKLCGAALAPIPDANTGVRPGASLFQETLSTNWIRARRRLQGQRQSVGTDGSWPNWQDDVRHSAKLRDLWKRPNPRVYDLLRRILPPEDVRPNPADYPNGEVFLFVPMLSLKLWFDQWHSLT